MNIKKVINSLEKHQNHFFARVFNFCPLKSFRSLQKKYDTSTRSKFKSKKLNKNFLISYYITTKLTFNYLYLLLSFVTEIIFNLLFVILVFL